MLPDAAGWRSRAACGESDVPIILLTSRRNEVDKVFGLEAGRTPTSPSRTRPELWLASARTCGVAASRA